jgi:hypothetical protein
MAYSYADSSKSGMGARVFVKYFHFTHIFIPGVGENVLSPSKSEAIPAIFDLRIFDFQAEKLSADFRLEILSPS